ncbi:MAG: HAD-IA family hydrolase [Planctomycetota bacterium]|nr:HAD-IA family hydrolase [Planctomycetota bacterium]
MPETLLFDLDGTLVDSLPDIAASTNYLRRHFDLPLIEPARVGTMVGDGLAALLQRALAECSEANLEEAEVIYRTHHEKQCTRLVVAFPGVRKYLAHWHSEGHQLGVVTNKPVGFSQRILKHLDLARFLPVVIGGDSTLARKPDPEPVLEALAQLGASTENAMMVGDSPADILAGRAAGIRTAAVLFGYRSEPVLRETGADEYWPRFGEAEPNHGSPDDTP